MAEQPREEPSSSTDGLVVKTTFPRAYILKELTKYKERTKVEASVYMAAVLEYLTQEVLELSGDAAMENNAARIKPRHIMLAVRSDDDLDKLMKDVDFSQAGCYPYVQTLLLPFRNLSKNNEESMDESSEDEDYV